MRVIIFGYHLSFLTAIEDYLLKKNVEFQYLGKNISEDFRDEICNAFNRNERYQAIIVDLSEDLTNIMFTTECATILMAEVFWDPEKMA